MKRKIFLFTTLILAILLSSACSSENEPSDQSDQNQKDELILAIGGEPEDGFDTTAGWGQYGSPLFQSTLLRYDQDFNVQSDLATDYAVSDDGLTWTVELRDDVKFSDGEELTADDVVFTFETAKISGSVIDLSNLEKVVSTDEYTVQFTLIEPASSFITLLSSTGIVPEHAYNDEYNENPIGSGPFVLEQWDKGQQIIVEQNPYYYGEKPEFQKLTFLFLAEDAAFAAAKSGEVDVVSIPPTFAKEEVDGMELIELDTVDNRGVMLPYVPSGEVAENGAPIGNDVTADEAIRKAINIGVNREVFVDGVLEGFGTPAHSVADNLPWWNPDTVIEDNDVEQAKQILDEAGWQETEEGVREKDGTVAELTLLYPAGDQIRQSLSILFAEQMKPLGIEVSTEGKSWNELELLMSSNPVMMGWGSHDPLEIFNLYSSETRGLDYYNVNYYANDVVDDYINKALYATTEEEANDFWQKAQWDGETGFSAKGDAPWAWLVNIQHLYFINENLDIGEQKVQPHGHGWPVTDFIEQWQWKR